MGLPDFIYLLCSIDKTQILYILGLLSGIWTIIKIYSWLYNRYAKKYKIIDADIIPTLRGNTKPTNGQQNVQFHVEIEIAKESRETVQVKEAFLLYRVEKPEIPNARKRAVYKHLPFTDVLFPIRIAESGQVLLGKYLATTRQYETIKRNVFICIVDTKRRRSYFHFVKGGRIRIVSWFKYHVLGLQLRLFINAFRIGVSASYEVTDDALLPSGQPCINFIKIRRGKMFQRFTIDVKDFIELVKRNH